jgi:hypothetical protein
MFAISAIDGSGCRELTYAVQDWLDAHPPAAPDATADDAPEVVTPQPVRERRRRPSEA